MALVMAAPFDESVVNGETYETGENFNPADPNSFFKIKKLKKLLFLG